MWFTETLRFLIQLKSTLTQNDDFTKFQNYETQWSLLGKYNYNLRYVGWKQRRMKSITVTIESVWTHASRVNDRNTWLSTTDVVENFPHQKSLQHPVSFTKRTLTCYKDRSFASVAIDRTWRYSKLNPRV